MTALAETRTSESIRYLVVALQGQLFGLSLACVREATRMVALKQFGAAHPCMLGTLDLRGELVPVLDLGALVGLKPSRMGLQDILVVLDTPDGVMALPVENVDGLEALSDVPQKPGIALAGLKGLSGIFHLDERLVGVVDLTYVARLGAIA